MRMTYSIALSLGLDAANRQMRQAGRTVWNEDDAGLAARTPNYHLSAGVEDSGHLPESRRGGIEMHTLSRSIDCRSARSQQSELVFAEYIDQQILSYDKRNGTSFILKNAKAEPLRPNWQRRTLPRKAAPITPRSRLRITASLKRFSPFPQEWTLLAAHRQ